MKRYDEFFIVVVDRDKKQFNVIGPMSNDQWINRRVLKAQEEGRDVYCFTSNKATKQKVIENTISSSSFTGFVFTEENLV